MVLPDALQNERNCFVTVIGASKRRSCLHVGGIGRHEARLARKKLSVAETATRTTTSFLSFRADHRRHLQERYLFLHLGRDQPLLFAYSFLQL